MPNVTKKDRVAERNAILEQFAEGTIHLVEMVESVLATVEPEDLREYFVTGPARFAEKTGIQPEHCEASRKSEMRHFAARLFNFTAGLLAETFDGFVPSITTVADGTILVVEQDLAGEEHRQFPNTVPTKTHTMKG